MSYIYLITSKRYIQDQLLIFLYIISFIFVFPLLDVLYIKAMKPNMIMDSL